MSNIRILISCHKKSDIRHDDIYLPIQVGRANSCVTLDMIGDDTGDNISAKNPNYCELTAHYWAWKNLKDVDIVGFCHYRRYFPKSLDAQGIEHLIGGGRYDVLAIRTSRFSPIHEKWTKYVSPEDLVIMMKVVQRLYPEYADSLNRFLWGNQMCSFNMLIMKKDKFDEYAEWLFSILEECEKYIRLSPYSRGRRVYGYLAEILMYAYIQHNHLSVRGYNVEECQLQGNPRIMAFKNWMLYRITDVSYFLSLAWLRKKLQHYNTLDELINRYYLDQVLGLRNDGVDLF